MSAITNSVSDLIKERQKTLQLEKEINALFAIYVSAKKYIDLSPGDPDVTAEQFAAWNEYQLKQQEYRDLLNKICDDLMGNGRDQCR